MFFKILLPVLAAFSTTALGAMPLEQKPVSLSSDVKLVRVAETGATVADTLPAAISGARRSSLEPGSTVVRVDRSPPSSVISGTPNEWVNHPVTLTVQATDQLSGMLPKTGDDGTPETVIDADNYATYRSPGPIATFSVASARPSFNSRA